VRTARSASSGRTGARAIAPRPSRRSRRGTSRALRALVEHGRTRARPLYEPADFTDVELDRASLDRIVEAVTRGRKGATR
jgi:hypothetical protein